MIVSLSIVLGLSSKVVDLEKQFKELNSRYEQSLGVKGELKFASGVNRVNAKMSKDFETIAVAAGKSPLAVKAWTITLFSGQKDLARENRILDVLTKSFISHERLDYLVSTIPIFTDFKSTFATSSRIAGLSELILQKSPHKSIRAPLLLAKANRMDDILDLKWEVYNRLVEQYPGTEAAKEARTIILRKKHLQPGDLFPDFVSKDSDGKRFQLTEYRGKVVVLEFWASWCPSCERTIPIMQGVEKQFADQNVAFVGVNSDGGAQMVKDLEAKYKMTHRNLVDGSPAGPISIAYNIMAWPSFIVIGKDGKVVFRTAGIDADGMTKAIAEALK
jgi:thiol-disulfide isomerase/thioredoxin